LDALDHLARVFAEAGDDHAADGLGAGLVEGTAAQGGAVFDPGQLRARDRHVFAGGNDHLGAVVEARGGSVAATDVISVVDLDGAGADVEVAAAYGAEDLGEGDAVVAQCVGIDVDLVLANEAADGGDLGDAFDTLEGVADQPVLRAAQFVEIPAAGRFTV